MSTSAGPNHPDPLMSGSRTAGLSHPLAPPPRRNTAPAQIEEVLIDIGDDQAHELTDLSSQMGESRIDTGDDQTHELSSLSPDLMALHQRIAALEATIKNMEQALETNRTSTDHRIAVLEAIIKKELAAIITPWRLLNTVVVLGVGAYKAVTTYLGQTTGPTTADWIIGVAWTLIAYWVSFFDDPTPSHSSWFFARDVSKPSGLLLLFLVYFGLFFLGCWVLVFLQAVVARINYRILLWPLWPWWSTLVNTSTDLTQTVIGLMVDDSGSITT
ncbi:hypothetical protein B0H13DRAFT_2262944 [Mycena leptocephala]|nr:hypothetical protein B0H13DRAFT_2262944 [Mycena leptocephala]